MKSNPPTMNTDQPDAASPSSVHDDLCIGHNPNVTALQVFADDQHSYLFPYAQFLYAELVANPALEKEADAPPQKLLISFVQAEITVLGSGLTRIEHWIQISELGYIKPADRRYATALKGHVASVTLILTKETV
jgi:hypothetical protein